MPTIQNWPTMEISADHLRLVTAAAEHAHVPAAAAALQISSAALLVQLDDLESEFGTTLFERRGERLTLTDSGRQVYAGATRVLDGLLAMADMALRARGSGSVLRFGGVTTSYFSPTLAQLVDDLPHRRVTAHPDASSETLARQLVDGELDAVLLVSGRMHADPLPSYFRQRVIIEHQPALIAAGEATWVAERDVVDLADLATESWLLPHAQTGGYDRALIEAFVQAGYTPRTPYGRGRLSDYPDLIAAGRVIALANPTTPPPPGVTLVPLAPGTLADAVVLRWRAERLLDEEAATIENAVRSRYLTALDEIACRQRWWQQAPWSRPTLSQPTLPRSVKHEAGV